MGTTWKNIMKVVARIFSPAIALASVMFREAIKDFIIEQYMKAKETENPWDDFLFELLASLFAISLPD